MKINVRELKKAVREELIKASDTYMRKEAVRGELEKLIKQHVRKGQIQTQADLEDYVNSVGLAMTALKMVPIEVWQKMVGTVNSSKE